MCVCVSCIFDLYMPPIDSPRNRKLNFKIECHIVEFFLSIYLYLFNNYFYFINQMIATIRTGENFYSTDKIHK